MQNKYATIWIKHAEYASIYVTACFAYLCCNYAPPLWFRAGTRGPGSSWLQAAACPEHSQRQCLPWNCSPSWKRSTQIGQSSEKNVEIAICYWVFGYTNYTLHSSWTSRFDNSCSGLEGQQGHGARKHTPGLQSQWLLFQRLKAATKCWHCSKVTVCFVTIINQARISNKIELLLF